MASIIWAMTSGRRFLAGRPGLPGPGSPEPLSGGATSSFFFRVTFHQPFRETGRNGALPFSYLPRRPTDFGLVIRPVAPVVWPGLSGVMTASGTGGIGLSGGAGFFIGMTAGLTFGMPASMRLLANGNKAQGFGRLYGHARFPQDVSFPSPVRVPTH